MIIFFHNSQEALLILKIYILFYREVILAQESDNKEEVIRKYHLM